MSDNTFASAGNTYKITVYPGVPGGKRFPMILLVHGNFGLGPPGDQIRGFAKEFAGRGYVTAVPQYYLDDGPHLTDTATHDRTLADAVAAVASRSDADVDRIGLIGFSLGASTAMTFVASNPPGTVKVLADFFGVLTPTIEAGISSLLMEGTVSKVGAVTQLVVQRVASGSWGATRGTECPTACRERRSEPATRGGHPRRTSASADVCPSSD